MFTLASVSGDDEMCLRPVLLTVAGNFIKYQVHEGRGQGGIKGEFTGK
jgi:hypothetical protein